MAKRKQKKGGSKQNRTGKKASRVVSPEKKWRHHYVWQHYHKAWTGPDSKVCYAECGNYARKATKEIAFTRDFYRLKEISDDEMKIVDGLIDRMGEPYRTLA